MSYVTEIIEKINNKEELFLEYENLTFKALGEKSESLIQMLENRAKLIEKIDTINIEIDRIVSAQQDSARINAALNNSDNRKDVTAELLPIFDTAQHLFTIINRIMEHDKELIIHIETERKNVRDNIKITNQKSKIASFLPHPTKGIIFNKKG